MMILQIMKTCKLGSNLYLCQVDQALSKSEKSRKQSNTNLHSKSPSKDKGQFLTRFQPKNNFKPSLLFQTKVSTLNNSKFCLGGGILTQNQSQATGNMLERANSLVKEIEAEVYQKTPSQPLLISEKKSTSKASTSKTVIA